MEDKLDKTSNFLDIEVEEEHIVVNDVQCSGLNNWEYGDVISGFLEHTNRNISEEYEDITCSIDLLTLVINEWRESWAVKILKIKRLG